MKRQILASIALAFSMLSSAAYAIDVDKLSDLAASDLQRRHDDGHFISSTLKAKIESFEEGDNPIKLDILFLSAATEDIRGKMSHISSILKTQGMRMYGSASLTVGTYKIAQFAIQLRTRSDAELALRLFRIETAIYVEESKPSAAMIEL